MGLHRSLWTVTVLHFQDPQVEQTDDSPASKSLYEVCEAVDRVHGTEWLYKGHDLDDPRCIILLIAWQDVRNAAPSSLLSFEPLLPFLSAPPETHDCDFSPKLPTDFRFVADMFVCKTSSVDEATLRSRMEKMKLDPGLSYEQRSDSTDGRPKRLALRACHKGWVQTTKDRSAQDHDPVVAMCVVLTQWRKREEAERSKNPQQANFDESQSVDGPSPDAWQRGFLDQLDDLYSLGVRREEDLVNFDYVDTEEEDTEMESELHKHFAELALRMRSGSDENGRMDGRVLRQPDTEPDGCTLGKQSARLPRIR